MDDVLFVIVGTEGGKVVHVQVLMEPASEHYAIESAERLFKKNKRRGVEVSVWDATTDKVIYVIPG